jgi:hypothetical protein
MSGHRLWADISDGEDDLLSDWGEGRMLPETLLASPESETPRSMPQKTEDLLAEQQASSHMLNAYAPEFLPTLTMSCPLVGMCNVIMEGDEGEDAQASELRFVPADCVVPMQSKGQSSGKKFWRTSREAHALAPLEVPPRVLQDLPEKMSDEQMQRRIRSVEVCKDTKEYQFHIEQIKLRGPGAEPLTPDPRDSTISKRRWVRVVQQWREELRRRYLLETGDTSLENVPEVASVASTEAEETQGSEAGDSTTVDSDAASSYACWSSR